MCLVLYGRAAGSLLFLGFELALGPFAPMDTFGTHRCRRCHRRHVRHRHDRRRYRCRRRGPIAIIARASELFGVIPLRWLLWIKQSCSIHLLAQLILKYLVIDLSDFRVPNNPLHLLWTLDVHRLKLMTRH